MRFPWAPPPPPGPIPQPSRAKPCRASRFPLWPSQRRCHRDGDKSVASRRPGCPNHRGTARTEHGSAGGTGGVEGAPAALRMEERGVDVCTEYLCLCLCLCLYLCLSVSVSVPVPVYPCTMYLLRTRMDSRDTERQTARDYTSDRQTACLRISAPEQSLLSPLRSQARRRTHVQHALLCPALPCSR